jgi:acyl-CoA thioesterase-1
MAPIFLRGLSEPYGFWNTICTLLRSARTRSGLTSTASPPARSSLPPLGFSISAITRASVDLPQPDSPTTASVRPGSIVNEMPPTACRRAGSLNRPRRIS